ncbi:MAG: cupin domain-containing protein [Candidatus Cloacimonetes bacterium]|nr:cupin domain-containing protein [Candidatus Cloacimonadota bacterium]
MSFDAAMIIEHFGLTPLEFEGGYYKQTYIKENEKEIVSTCIYYLLTKDTKSILHKLKSDEVYHFYLGDPVELTVLGDDGKNVTLGNNVFDGEELQYVVKAGEWQGSCLKKDGTWALLGTTMAPGFKLEDFEAGNKEKLMVKYPSFISKIETLT